MGKLQATFELPRSDRIPRANKTNSRQKPSAAFAPAEDVIGRGGKSKSDDTRRDLRTIFAGKELLRVFYDLRA